MRRRGGRPLSRREARRLAEIRRREIEEARRRALLARLAAIARQRAADQALRDEAVANISRDNTIGEDLEVRRAAVAALGGHAGTVVVMDPKTGRIYSIVNQEWAVRRGFKPCSTIKLVTGLAGLTEKVIDPVQEVNISAVNYGLDLTDALAYSNNGYFQSVGGRLGFERMMKYARELGLGERTGVNHANEYPGRVPVFKSGWAVNHMSSHGDDFEVTPIQLATLVSTIANGGSVLVPHLPRTPEEDVQFKTEVRRRVDIPQDAMRRMIPGMIGAVTYGSGKKAYDPMQTIAGKTGTCIGQGGWLGLFTSYAPVADPRLAVVVVGRGSDAHNHFPAAVAGRIYHALSGRFGKLNTLQIATTPDSLKPHPKIDPKAAAAVNDEEKEVKEAEVEEMGGEAATGTTAGIKADAPRDNVKSVLMSVPARPTEVTTQPAKAENQAPRQGEEQRPRRVLTTQP